MNMDVYILKATHLFEARCYEALSQRGTAYSHNLTGHDWRPCRTWRPRVSAYAAHKLTNISRTYTSRTTNEV
jgi:hypothetical protein